MKLSNREKTLVFCLLIVLGLLGMYFVLTLFLPGRSIWSIPKTFNETSNPISIKSQNVYEQEFEMPFSKLCSIGIPLSHGSSNYVVSLDVKMEVFDKDGTTVAEKTITSVFDSTCGFKYVNVNRGEKYRLKLTVNSVGNGATDDEAPRIYVTDEGKVRFQLRGLPGDSSEKSVFAIMYIIAASAFLIFLAHIDREKIGDCIKADNVIVGLLILVGMLFVCQFSDLFDISLTALKMLDSFKHGIITGYNDYMYFNAIADQSVSQTFACDYNFITILICAIFLIPVYLIYGTDINISHGGYAAAYTLLFVIAAALMLSYYLLKRIVSECGMGDRYLANVRGLFISSSMIMYMTVVFGQIDILYLLVIVISLPFYYRKKYLFFSIIMSVAISMKTLPIMVFVPLVLLANKRVRDILLNFAVGMVFPVLTKIFFEGNVGHSMLATSNAAEYGFVERVTNAKIGQVSLFILAFVVICVFAYMSNVNTENKKEMLYYSMLVIFVTYSGFAAFVDWHQQWLTPLVLAFTFLLPYHENNKKLLLLDIFAEGLFIITSNTGGVSMYMVNFGIFPVLFGQRYGGTNMKYLLNSISPIAIPAVRSMFVGILAYMVWQFTKQRKDCQKTYECSRFWAIGRTGVLYGIILFYCWCFSYIG